MKKVCFMIFVAVCFTSCSDDPQPNIKELVLANIKETAFVLDEAFARTTQILQEQGDLETLVSTSASRDAFITKMNDLVKDVVLEVVESDERTSKKWSSDRLMVWNNTTNTKALQGYLKEFPFGITGPNPGTGALELYSEEIDNALDLLQGELVLLENYTSRQGKQIPIDSYSFSFGGQARGLFKPGLTGEATKVTIDLIKMVKENIGNMTISYSGLELDAAIEDFVANNTEAGLLMGLLLPAVQKVGTDFPGTANSYTGLTNIVEGTLITPERIAWDKQVRYAAFLAALYFIISEDFDNYNEDYASIPLQDAAFNAACTLWWSRIYDKYKR